MALTDLHTAPAPSRFWLACHRGLRAVFGRGTIAPDSPEDARARRQFIQDVIAAQPDAFQSEADVQCMLHLYPGKF